MRTALRDNLAEDILPVLLVVEIEVDGKIIYTVASIKELPGCHPLRLFILVLGEIILVEFLLALLEDEDVGRRLRAIFCKRRIRQTVTR